jgi:hypothetical protein
MIKKRNFGIVLFLLAFALLPSFISAEYIRSGAQYISPGAGSGFFSGSTPIDRSACEAGQDFIVQVSPLGCSPTVVRSDLLEEQNAAVLCPLAATKINPLIDVESIKDIDFRLENGSKYITGISFQHAKAALGLKEKLNSPVLNNIGYAVIVLREQKNASLMPDYVEGKLVATIRYDIENAFGIGTTTFNLPDIADSDWDNEKAKYSFWNGKFYIKAEGIDEEGAQISIYDDVRRISSINIDKGKKSDTIYLPGFDCYAGLQLSLSGLGVPEARARIDVNGEVYEAAKNEKFFENRCTVKDLRRYGVYESVSLSCNGDDKRSEAFTLIISPKIKLNIAGEVKEYGAGEKLFEYQDNGKLKAVYLGYVGSLKDSKKESDLYTIIVESTQSKEKLSDDELSKISRLAKSYEAKKMAVSITDHVSSESKSIVGILTGGLEWIITGTNYHYISYKESKEIGEKDKEKAVTLEGFVDPVDGDLLEAIKNYYGDANVDYDKILDSYLNEKIDDKTEFGEAALYNKAKLAGDLNQSRTAMDLCEEFKEKYPNSNKNLVFCDAYKLANSYLSSRHIVVNGKLRQISLENIYEPSPDDYSAEMLINGERYVFTKDEIKYLEGGVVSGGLGKTSFTNIINSKLGSQCSQYAGQVYDSAIKYGIDPLLLASVMKQESNCNVDANSKTDAVGLMQIISWATDLNGNDVSCKSKIPGVNSKSDLEGPNNVGKNIECGALILSTKYKLYGQASSRSSFEKDVKESCLDSNYRSKYLSYQEWDAALRAYNTLDCDSKADLDFVENINSIYSPLKTASPAFATTTSGTKSVQLMGLGTDYAEVKISGVSGTKTVRKGIVEDFGSGYTFNLVEVKLKKLAKVTINPKVENAGSKAIVPFKIGIEKRSIKLSPEQTSDLIKKTNERIAKWDSLTNKLGGVVKDLKTACLATGAVLTAKNFLNNVGLLNLGGKASARTAVMRSKGGWVDKCTDLVNNGTYKDVDFCFSDKASEIDRDVNNYNNEIDKQNKEIKELESRYTKTGFLGDRTINDELFLKDYLTAAKPKIEECLIKRYPNGIDNQGNKIEIDKFISSLNENTTTIKELRELQLNCRLEGGLLAGMADKTLQKSVIDINTNSEFLKKVADDSVKYGGIKPDYAFDKDTRVIEFSGDYTLGDLIYSGNLPTAVSLVETNQDVTIDSHVRIVVDKVGDHLVVLDKDNHVDKTYRINDDASLVKTSDKNPLNIDFKKVNAQSYNNAYKNPKVRYFETEPYKGMPGIVPFDLEHGWYAVVKQTLPVLGGIRAYDESGRVNSLYICNVGENGLEENMKKPDDSCTQINLGTGQPYNQISGLSESDAKALVKKATDAISEARTNQGQSEVQIGKYRIKVGEPMADIPDLKCQDIMSPTDCKILFNVCDPVICPSSRCDLGGTYPVKDVVQSGFAGSLLLCSKNFVGFGGDVFVPVCLSGIHASMDGWNQIQKAYRDCLQNSLDTGQMTGICDEIYSIHKCEFFWRQGLPWAKYLLPKAIETIAGQNVKGGGEYLDVRSAFNNADKSVKYFTQYYADNSYAAFKARSAEQIGTQACKAYVSASFPSFDSLVDTLTEPDSPVQFHGRFDEIPYTTATNPPISQYKVWYFIYAGKDRGGYYQVYLKEGPESSYYQDASYNRIVASGYIGAGERVDKTPDFTAPSGYKELCIRVNEQETCGFKQVSTDFGVNYVKDLYMAQQANQTNIQGTKECVAGTPSLYSVLSPNSEGAASEVINPSIYNRGIIRICATENPGKTSDSYYGTDKQRWREVGECDDNLKCWLDGDSVKNVIYATNLEKGVLNNTKENQLAILKNENGFLSNEDFANLIDNLTKSSDPNKKIKLVDENLPKTFLSNEKAKLHLFRGDAYAELARGLWDIEAKKVSEAAASAASTITDQDAQRMKKELENMGIKIPDGMSNEEIKSIYDRNSQPSSFTDYPIIRMHTSNGAFYYQYGEESWGKEGVWWWSTDKNTFIYVPSCEDHNNQVVKFNCDIVSDLYGDGYDISYEEGLKILVDKTIGNKGTLSSDSVEFSGSDKLFKVNRGITRIANLKYQNEVWEDVLYSDPADLTVQSTKIKNDLINSLKGKNLYQGAEIIFNTDLKQVENNVNRDKWTLDTAKSKIDSFLTDQKNYGDLKYSENDNVKEFIDQLYEDLILTQTEYKEINGEGLFNLEENLSYVKRLLQKKSIPK